MEISQIASAMASLIDVRPLQDPFRPIVIPNDDDPIEADTEMLGYAEGQTFMIEYIDSKGRSSTRRVSVYDIVGGRSGGPCLLAKCHERHATRQFRIDRIQCCIDYDGVVYDDVTSFLTTTFGMSISVARSKERDDDVARWKSIIDALRADAVLLSALSRVDGKVKVVETSEAVVHLVRLVERGDIFLSDADVASVEAYVKRLRPTHGAVSRALEAIAMAGTSHIQRLLLAAVRVIKADEVVHPQELNLVNDISRELIGVDIMA